MPYTCYQVLCELIPFVGQYLMDPGSNPMQPSLALMAILTSGLLSQSNTRPWQPPLADRALGHGSHLTPVGPQPTGLLLSGLATQSPSLHPSVPPIHPVL